MQRLVHAMRTCLQVGLKLLAAFLGSVGDDCVKAGVEHAEPVVRAAAAPLATTRLVKRVVACLDVR